MGVIVDLARARRRIERRLLVAVDDVLFPWLGQTRFTTDAGIGVEYVAASALADPARDADLWIGRYRPSAPGRRLFFQTLRDETFEFDTQYRIWRNAELVWTEPLVDLGTPSSGERGVLRTGEGAALLFAARVDDGWHLRVAATAPLVLVGQFPRLPGGAAIPNGWLTMVRPARREQVGGAS